MTMRVLMPGAIATIALFLNLAGCEAGSSIGATKKLPPVERSVSWTLLVYMNGDNDLEAQALRDINEMEASDSMDRVDVVVLVDRNVGYDSGDGDWSGTRLYRVKRDPDGMNYTIVSERLAFEGLGLSAEGDVDELNLGSATVLSTFVSYGLTHFPARRTALVIWGHGSGWRGGGDSSFEKIGHGGESGSYRAFSFDDGSGDFLHTTELEDAVAGKGLDIIGFDTCSSMMLEVAYQLREVARYMVGSEDVISSEGWNYQRIISRLDEGELEVQEAAKVILDIFESEYANSSGATISVVDLPKVGAVKDALDRFVAVQIAEAEATEDPEAYYRNLRERILDEVESFHTAPGDFNIDVAHLGEVLEGEGSALNSSVDDAVVYSFASPGGNANARGIALHLVPLNELGRTLRHDDGYFQDGVVGYTLDFVTGSSWCPNETEGRGLLWKLFY